MRQAAQTKEEKLATMRETADRLRAAGHRVSLGEPDERPRVHPAAAAFPMLDDEALQGLADDIEEHGLIEPIVVHDGVILDGRNRLRACELVDVEPDFRDWEGDEADIVAWIVSKNLHRRHLDTSQRAMVAAKLKALWSDLTPDERPAGKLRDVAATTMNVSTGSVTYAEQVLGSGDAELVRQVEQGEVAVSAAADQLKPRCEELHASGRSCERAVGHPGSHAYETPDCKVSWVTDADLAVGPAPAECGALHPETGRPCTEKLGHTWTHGYIADGRRVPWAVEGAPLPPVGPDRIFRTETSKYDQMHEHLGPRTEDGSDPDVLDDPMGELAEVDTDTNDYDMGTLVTGSEAEALLERDEALAQLPDDERAALDAYWTPDATAVACVRWLCTTLDLPANLTAIEPAAGGGAWVRALGGYRPLSTIDRVDIDPMAPGVLQCGLGGGAGYPGKDWLTWKPRRNGKAHQWDLCIGNPPYGGDLVRWLDLSLSRAATVAYLLRETVTGSLERLPWWLSHPPAYVVKVLPRPRWEGPGARTASDTSDSILVVWHAGQTDTRFRWLDVREQP